MTVKKSLDINFLRTLAMTVAVIGATCSLYFMFIASRGQKSVLLIVLFTGWILSPFAGLFLADKICKLWTASSRSLLYWLMIILTIGSLVAYSGAFNTLKTKNAFRFLIVPLISWLIMTIVILIARRQSRKTNNTSSDSKN
ncbi:MAG: hypothetical protein ABI091_08960 [Ferruginibacter sp.]